MFIFRSRRSSLVKRLWRLQPGDDNNGERRAVATAVLKRLKEPALEGLVRALEGSGKDSGVCCLVPKGGLRLGRLGTVSPQVLTAQLFRWPDVQEEEQLVQVKPLCENQDQDLFVCCNPWHWARALPSGPQGRATRTTSPSPPLSSSSSSPPPLPPPGSPPLSSSQSELPPYSLLPPNQSPNTWTDRFEGSSVATDGEGGSQQRFDTLGRVSWCSLAYWEERRRVGRLFPVHTSGVEVFAIQPKPPPIGDALSLSQLAQAANHRPSEATLRTREKIGLGLILSHDDDGVWAYNRTEVPIFVNSPTLDLPNSRTFSVFKIPPGYTLQIFSWAVAQHYARIRDPLLQDGPFDPHAVRLSFAKGWGSKYSRQSVDCCPCWLEVLLRPPER